MWELHCQQTGGIIGDEMGLGKTVQVIALLASLHYSKMLPRGQPTLLVVPATMLAQWMEELHKWYPPLRVLILHDCGAGMNAGLSHRSLLQLAVSSGSVVVTTYGAVRLRSDLILPINWKYVALDEGHIIRNPEAEITMIPKI